MRRLTWSRTLGLLLLASCGGACASYSDLRFAPSVQDDELRGETGDLEARVTVAWLGIEERDGVREVRLRMRIEDAGPTRFTLVPAEFELLDAALTTFGLARPADLPVVLEPGQDATFDLVFPVRDGASLDAFDLTALTLCAKLQGGRWSWNTTFERAVPHPHHSPWSFSFGAGWVID